MRVQLDTVFLDSGDNAKSIVRVFIDASGGAGGYRYFKDDIAFNSPNIEFTWQSCTTVATTFHVEDANGDRVSTPWSTTTPCP
jgi:hypothetical protein